MIAVCGAAGRSAGAAGPSRCSAPASGRNPSRPAGTGPEFVAEQADYDRVLRERAADDPQLTVLDTADRGAETTVDRVGAWVTAALEA